MRSETVISLILNDNKQWHIAKVKENAFWRILPLHTPRGFCVKHYFLLMRAHDQSEPQTQILRTGLGKIPLCFVVLFFSRWTAFVNSFSSIVVDYSAGSAVLWMSGGLWLLNILKDSPQPESLCTSVLLNVTVDQIIHLKDRNTNV